MVFFSFCIDLGTETPNVPIIEVGSALKARPSYLAPALDVLLTLCIRVKSTLDSNSGTHCVVIVDPELAAIVGLCLQLYISHAPSALESLVPSPSYPLTSSPNLPSYSSSRTSSPRSSTIARSTPVSSSPAHHQHHHSHRHQHPQQQSTTTAITATTAPQGETVVGLLRSLARTIEKQYSAFAVLNAHAFFLKWFAALDFSLPYLRSPDLLFEHPVSALALKNIRIVGLPKIVGGCRPFVMLLQNDGIIFSSLTHGGGPKLAPVGVAHVDIPVPSTANIRGDVVFKLYHLPIGAPGLLLTSFAFHTSMVSLSSASYGSLYLERHDVDERRPSNVEQLFSLPPVFSVLFEFLSDHPAGETSSADVSSVQLASTQDEHHASHTPLSPSLDTPDPSAALPTHLSPLANASTAVSPSRSENAADSSLFSIHSSPSHPLSPPQRQNLSLSISGITVEESTDDMEPGDVLPHLPSLDAQSEGGLFFSSDTRSAPAVSSGGDGIEVDVGQHPLVENIGHDGDVAMAESDPQIPESSSLSLSSPLDSSAAAITIDTTTTTTDTVIATDPSTAATLQSIADPIPASESANAPMNQMEADEAFARSLQVQFDEEVRRGERATLAHQVQVPPQRIGQLHRRSYGLEHRYERGHDQWREQRLNATRTSQGWVFPEHPQPSQRPSAPTIRLSSFEDLDTFIALLHGMHDSPGRHMALIQQLPVSPIQEASRLLGSTCQICCDEYEVGAMVKTLPCLHMYHDVCIDRWLMQKGTCPVCQTPINNDETFTTT